MTMTQLASVVFVVFIVVAIFSSASVKFNDRPVRNPLVRAAAMAIAFPFVGLVFYILGVVGHFMLLPVISLFR